MNKLNNLIHVQRYSGTQLIKSESVSDHVWGMISLAIDWVEKFNNKLGNNTLNLKDVIYRCAIHDIGEAYTLDIPRPFKYHNEEIHEAIESTEQSILSENLDENLIKDINTAKDRSTNEGKLVCYLDTIQAGEKMVSEIRFGNFIMFDELPNVIEVLEGRIGDLYNNTPSKIEECFIEMMNHYLDKYNNILKNYKPIKIDE